MTPKELQEKRNKLFHDMKALNDKHHDGMDEAAAQKWDAMEQEFDALGKQIERMKRLDDFEATLNAPASNPLVGGTNQQGDPQKSYDLQAHKEAFFDMVRNGASGMSASSKKILASYRAAQVEGTDSKGGYLVPTQIASEIITGLNAASWIRQLANVYSTANTTDIPIDTGLPQFDWLGEGSTYTEKEQTFGSVTIGAHKVGGIIKVSEELLEDSAFNLEAHLIGKMQAGYEQAEEVAFLTGDGSGKPTGITVTAATGVTAAAADAITSDEVVEFVYALKARYRTDAAIVASSAWVKAVRKLKDGNGQYLWQPSYQAGQPDMLLGKPLYESEHMAALTSGEKPAVIANWRYYDIADRGGMFLQRLNEKYADEGMIGFRIRKRTDGKLTLTDAAANFVMG